MITFTRRNAQFLRSLLRRRALGLPIRGDVAPLVLKVDPRVGLRVRYQQDHMAIECLLPGPPRPRETIAIPLDALNVLQEPDDSPITFEKELDHLTVVNWTDLIFPKKERYQVPELASLPPFPSLPGAMHAAPIELLRHLGYASSLSSRFVLEASSGDIVDADGFHFSGLDGYQFPWNDDVILCGTKVPARKELQVGSLSVGRVRGHVVLKVGFWTVWLAEQTTLEPPDDE